MASSKGPGISRPVDSGSAPSTVSAKASAKRLTAIYWRTRDLPPIMHPDEIAGENAEFYFNTFFTWAATRPIPYNFNEQLLPTNPENRRYPSTEPNQDDLGIIIGSLSNASLHSLEGIGFQHTNNCLGS